MITKIQNKILLFFGTFPNNYIYSIDTRSLLNETIFPTPKVNTNYLNRIRNDNTGDYEYFLKRNMLVSVYGMIRLRMESSNDTVSITQGAINGNLKPFTQPIFTVNAGSFVNCPLDFTMPVFQNNTIILNPATNQNIFISNSINQILIVYGEPLEFIPN